MQKKALRHELRERLSRLGPEEIQRRSNAACQRLCDQKEYERAESVMLFLSTAYEVDSQPIALKAWAAQKRVLAPRVSWDQRRMLPIEIHSLSSTDVEEQPLGVRQPVEGLPVPVSEIDLVVVPGLGFDLNGNRLGSGRGFYDRFLSHPDFQGLTCGLSLEAQIVDSIPSGPLDVKVSMVVTDEQVRHFTR